MLVAPFHYPAVMNTKNQIDDKWNIPANKVKLLNKQLYARFRAPRQRVPRTQRAGDSTHSFLIILNRKGHETKLNDIYEPNTDHVMKCSLFFFVPR